MFNKKLLKAKKLQENTEVRLYRNDDSGVTSYSVMLMDLDVNQVVGDWIKFFGLLDSADKYYNQFTYE